MAATFCMPLIDRLPETRITRAPLACISLTNWLPLVTVTGEALPPPVVPPHWVAQPCMLNEAADALGVATIEVVTSTAAVAAASSGVRVSRRTRWDVVVSVLDTDTSERK
ncbi:hypothetical protein GCM10027615_11530 [Plantactinospora veratri]